MRFSGIFQTISFTVRKRFVNAFLPPPYTVGKPSKNAPKRLKKFAMPSAKTRTLCRRLAAPSHQKTALYGHFSASCRFLHSKLQPVGPFLILCAFSHSSLLLSKVFHSHYIPYCAYCQYHTSFYFIELKSILFVNIFFQKAHRRYDTLYSKQPFCGSSKIFRNNISGG